MHNHDNHHLWGWNSHWEDQFRPWAQAFLPARVSAQSHHIYTLQGPDGPIKARISGALEYRACGPEDYPALGDWVVYLPADQGEGVIQQILPRNSSVVRQAPADRGGSQVLAANLDLGIIVMGLDQDYSPSRADRYLTLLRQGGASGLVWLSKADLYPEKAQEARDELSLRWKDVPVMSGDSLTGNPHQALRPWLKPGLTLCLLGSSGAGKSTLINALAGQVLRRTGETRSVDGKGRHTSVDRVLLLLEDGTLLMDHPGLREVGLVGEEEILSDVFSPVVRLAGDCRFGDCTHSGEPGCRIQEALESGELEPGLWTSYQRQKLELAALARRTDPVLARQERDKWKAINKSMRGFSKATRHESG